MARRFLATLTLAVVLASCSSVPSRIARLESCPVVKPVTTMQVPYPIILLHGLGQKADVWHGDATGYFSKDLGLSYGGDLKLGPIPIRTIRLTLGVMS